MKTRLLCTAALAVATTLLMYPASAWPPPGGPGGGRISPASLDLDTCGCPTTFGDPVCEDRTAWTLEKTLDFYDPATGDFSFDVTVTENDTTRHVAGGGTIVLSNSGEQPAFLSSIAVLLEKEWDGNPHDNPAPGPGPSGRNWQVLGTATEIKEKNACDGTAATCYGPLEADDTSSLVILDASGDVIARLEETPIPPTEDNDGDGLRDEDPVYTGANDTANSCDFIDNDGDGSYDEDPVDFDEDGNPIDNDGDGLFNEDDPDDDGDGLVDEDGACEDAVVLTFEYDYDVTDLGLLEGDALRIDLIATFASGGRRGGTCTVDVDCDGTDEEYVRSIQQRFEFAMPACVPVCDCVTLTDGGAVADDEACVMVMSTTLGEEICATGIAGTETSRTVGGMVVCMDGECSTIVRNTATLEGDGCGDLVDGSPNGAQFDVDCAGGGGGGEGDFCTQTQFAWGISRCNANNTACLRDDYWLQAAVHFDPLYPIAGWLIVGDFDPLAGTHGVLLSGPAAVGALLPAVGDPAALSTSYLDPRGQPGGPQATEAGAFLGQLVAAKLNVAYDDAGIGKCTLTGDCTFPNAPGTLKTLVFRDGCEVADGLVGASVQQVIAWSECAISGQPLAVCGVPDGVTIPDLNDALAVLNGNYDNCDTDEGCLALP